MKNKRRPRRALSGLPPATQSVQQETKSSAMWTVRNTKGISIRLVRVQLPGDLPLKMDRQFGHRRVYLTRECKTFRSRLARALKQAWGRTRPPGRVLSFFLEVNGTRWRPDLDVVYYQLLNAGTIEAWGLDDVYLKDGGLRRRVDRYASPYAQCIFTYEVYYGRSKQTDA